MVYGMKRVWICVAMAAVMVRWPHISLGQNSTNGINGGYVGSDRWFATMRQSAANQAMLASLGSSRGSRELPPDYVEFAAVVTFPDGNPFPDKRFPDLRIAGRDKNADSVERAPFIDENGGFYTVFKKGQTYDVFWMYYFGSREQFASITIPGDSPRQRKLAIAYRPNNPAPASPPSRAASPPSVAPTPRPSPPPDANRFDISGLPPSPTTFEEQQIMAGLDDPTDPRAHERLARYYENKGDTKRANTEYEKARYWRETTRERR